MIRLRSLQKSFLCFGLGCVLSYFVYHMVEGERGLRAWGRLSKQLLKSQAQLAALEKEHAQLEHNIRLLGDEVDLDLLDQQVRELLDYSHPKDKIIPRDRLSSEVKRGCHPFARQHPSDT